MPVRGIQEARCQDGRAAGCEERRPVQLIESNASACAFEMNEAAGYVHRGSEVILFMHRLFLALGRPQHSVILLVI